MLHHIIIVCIIYTTYHIQKSHRIYPSIPPVLVSHYTVKITTLSTMKGAKYFYDSIFPSIILSLLLGLSPIFISNRGNERTLYTNKYLYSINLAYLIVFISLVIRTVSETKSSVMSNNYYEQNKISNIGIAFIFAGGILYVIIIYICGFLKTESIKKILERIFKLDQILEKFGQDLKYNKSVIYQLVTQSVAYILICIITAMQRENIQKEHFRKLSNTTWIVFIFPAVVVSTFEHQFVYTVLLVRQRFQMLNQQLKNLDNCKRDTLSKQASLLRCKDNLTVKKHEKFTDVTVLSFPQVFGGKTKEIKVSITLEKINILMRMQDELCDIAKIVSRNYTMQEVTVLMFQYGILLFSVFYSYWMFSTKPFSAICWIMWSILKASEVLHVTISCHLASQEAKMTNAIVHKLLIALPDIEVRNKLMVFSNQLMHRKVSFTIWGIVTLDATILYTMIGAATTYMVIMLQFQQASLPMTCKANLAINVTTMSSVH